MKLHNVDNGSEFFYRAEDIVDLLCRKHMDLPWEDIGYAGEPDDTIIEYITHSGALKLVVYDVSKGRKVLRRFEKDVTALPKVCRDIPEGLEVLVDSDIFNDTEGKPKTAWYLTMIQTSMPLMISGQYLSEGTRKVIN